MVGQIVIELGCDASDLWKLGVRDIREVVVLHMVAQVVGEVVEGAVVAVCGLAALVEQVVLRDEVSCCRVQAKCHEGTSDQVYQRLEAKDVVDERVEGELDN